MTETAALTALQYKRCKNAGETSVIVQEIDRRIRVIEDIGGHAPHNDVLVGVLWSAMDQQTRTHVSGNMDTGAEYRDLRMAVLKHVTLVGATASTKSPTAMDIGAIGNVGGAEKDEEQS